MSSQAHEGWRWLAIAGAMLALSAVFLGAAGSHVIGLDSDKARQSWAVAAQIHFFHAAAVLALAALSAALSTKLLATGSKSTSGQPASAEYLLAPGWLLMLGTVLFSGNIYLRAGGITWFPGWLTPAGGVILMLAWLLLILILIRKMR